MSWWTRCWRFAEFRGFSAGRGGNERHAHRRRGCRVRRVSCHRVCGVSPPRSFVAKKRSRGFRTAEVQEQRKQVWRFQRVADFGERHRSVGCGDVDADASASGCEVRGAFAATLEERHRSVGCGDVDADASASGCEVRGAFTATLEERHRSVGRGGVDAEDSAGGCEVRGAVAATLRNAFATVPRNAGVTHRTRLGGFPAWFAARAVGRAGGRADAAVVVSAAVDVHADADSDAGTYAGAWTDTGAGTGTYSGSSSGSGFAVSTLAVSDAEPKRSLPRVFPPTAFAAFGDGTPGGPSTPPTETRQVPHSVRAVISTPFGANADSMAAPASQTASPLNNSY